MQRLITIIILLALAGCFSSGQPTWVMGGSKAYPDKQYLTATGSAGTDEAAKRAALANLAKIFEVQINETSRDEASAWRSSQGEQVVDTGAQQLTVRYIDAYTTKLLEGAQIVEQWQDKNGQSYALAAVSKQQLSNKLRAEINKADRFIKTAMAKANRLAEPFHAAKALYRAQTALRQRELRQRDLQIVDVSGVGIRSAVSVEDLESQIDHHLQSMIVSGEVKSITDVTVLNASQFKQVLDAAVEAVGMRATDKRSDYILQGALDVKDLGQRDGWYWYRGALQVDLIAQDNLDQPLASRRWPLKASGQSHSQARVRLHDQVATTLNQHLRKALLSFGKQAAD